MGKERISNAVMIYEKEDGTRESIKWDDIKVADIDLCEQNSDSNNVAITIPENMEYKFEVHISNKSMNRFMNLLQYSWRAKSLYPRFHTLKKAYKLSNQYCQLGIILYFKNKKGKKSNVHKRSILF